MAWSTPPSWTTGGVVTKAKLDIISDDLNYLKVGPYDAWTTYTPTIAQGVSTNIAKTVDYSKCVKVGRTCRWQFRLAVTAAGTAGSAITVTLPFTMAYTTNPIVIGTAVFIDASVGQYNGVSILSTGSGTQFSMAQADVLNAGLIGASPNIALASGDFIIGSVDFETAS